MKLKSLLITIALVMLFACANQTSAAARILENEGEKKVEQTIAVEPNVIVSLCIASGSITVHGWERNEVQARSADAEAINFRRASVTNAGPASRIEVLISDPADGPEGRTDSCNAFSDVELNVPRGAIVQLQTRDGDVIVSDVTEARVETQNGDIDLQRISRLVEARCLSGDISLSDSSGRVQLGSVSGSVEAVNVRSLTAGDDFDAGTVSGDVMLEAIGHVQVHAKSVSGSVNMNGPLVHGGRYDFKTMSGDVTLSLPADSSFKVNAKVAHGGDIISDFTITPTADTTQSKKDGASVTSSATTSTSTVVSSSTSTSTSVTTTTSPTPPPAPSPAPRPAPAPRVSVVIAPSPMADPHGVERLNGIFGTGDATLNLASFSGTVHLRRR
jgi:DUF4097 and DUF4098 domain-containing protein YvlB